MLMKQKKMLALTLSQLVLLYRQEFPGLAALADASGDGERFRMGLREFVDAHRAAEGEAAEQIRLLIDYDGRSVRELSTDRQLEVRTLTLLWQFLTGRLENPEMPSDLFVDLYHLFRLLDAPEIPLRPSACAAAPNAGSRDRTTGCGPFAPTTANGCSTC